ncbi:hypothetical protein F5Y13DRAFT_173413 [Hypoxylon sp. FL1857]|nr:hypothetical protein F5Y13DRAFT_173413 [Hypoxylon sp. FL1857]
MLAVLVVYSLMAYGPGLDPFRSKHERSHRQESPNEVDTILPENLRSLSEIRGCYTKAPRRFRMLQGRPRTVCA